VDKRERKKLDYEEFFKMAILKLRDISKSRGIHSVFSGFNQAFREYFGEDPIKVTQELASKGKIEIRPVKRGVMIYLPDEAPQSRSDLGKTALSKILNEPPEYDKGLVEKVLSEVVSEGIKTFPEDFLEAYVENEMFEIVLPGTPLHIDSNSQTTVISSRRHFHHEAKNPPEAKYIIYAHKIGQREIKIPKDNRAVFKAVTSYEKYCQEIKHQCFTLFIKHINDEDMAELLTKEVEKRLDLRAKRNQV
jgi:hypothetical protein